MSIEGKVIIITGASSGIGAATTRALAKKHAKLVIGARRLDRLNELKSEFPDEEIITQKVDVTKLDEVQALADTAIKNFGRIDVLYNNAGVMPVNALINRAHDEWQRILNVNIMGVLNGIAAVLPTMVEQKQGHILAPGAVATELYNSIGNEDNRKAEIEVEKQIGLSADNIASSVVFAVDSPNNMDVNEVIIRPIKQDI